VLVGYLPTGCVPLPGVVDYQNTPWFDWGPYLWASGSEGRSDGLRWCDGQGGPCQFERHFRFGDLNQPGLYWGDYIHATADGARKVANELVKFITGQLPGPQASTWDWIWPWIQD
jgi:hypothetical protein